jgi:hypothetical protein
MVNLLLHNIQIVITFLVSEAYMRMGVDFDLFTFSTKVLLRFGVSLSKAKKMAQTFLTQ